MNSRWGFSYDDDFVGEGEEEEEISRKIFSCDDEEHNELRAAISVKEGGES